MLSTNHEAGGFHISTPMIDIRAIGAGGGSIARVHDGLLQVGLSVTLGLHNVSPAHDLVVRRVDYHDTAGRLLRRLVDRPHAVPPMATAEFRIDRDDPSGGSGANYIVEWAAPSGGSEPLVQAVMVGPAGRLGISLVSRGVPVAPPAVPARQ